MASVMDTSYKGLYGNHAGKTFDILLELIESGTALTDATPSKVIFLGTGLIDADLVVDVEASTGTGNSITMQFSDTEDFATVGISGPTQAIAAGFVGRMIIPFRNAHGNELPKAYVRLMPAVSTALTAGAFMGKK